MKNSVDNRLIWLNGKIVHLQDAKINVLAPTSQFGLNVFEGIRCYWNSEKEQLFAFRLQDHYERLQRSVKLLKIQCDYSIEYMKKAMIDVVKQEEYKENIAVRQTVFIDGFGSWSSKNPVGMFIAPMPKGMPSKEYNKKGLNCCISTWRRISDQNLSPRIKCGANYINSRMAQLEAWDNGYDCAIFLNERGQLSEGPGSCLFIVKNGELITPALTDCVLESITRDTVIKIALDLGITVQERQIDRTELYTCDEAFLCGSAMEITPIYSVDRYSITKVEGVLTSRLHKTYMDIVSGRDEKYSKWLEGIY